MNHQEMRILLCEAFARVFNREGSMSEMQCLQAVTWLESSYGQGWKPPGVGSHNYGAIQAGSNWTGETFSYTDTRPNADGTSTPYVTKFRKYPTPIDGAIDLCKVVYLNRGRAEKVLPPASRGDTLGFSRGLHATGYYEGFGKTVEDRIHNHHRAVMVSIRKQREALHEGGPGDTEPQMPAVDPTIRIGASGPLVLHLQQRLNELGAQLKPDGSFGPRTAAAVASFQRRAGLDADSIVGPKTWGALNHE